jgi:CRP-like cAMP-binding protein
MSSHRSNRLLAALSPEASQYLVSRSVAVSLPQKTSLYVAGQTPSHAYFMTSGMTSIMTTMEDGNTAEVGIVGMEGLIGGLHILGPAHIPTNAYVQLEGSALKIPLADLRKAFRCSEEIRDRMLEFYQVQSVTVSQIAACNRLHEAEERLARWLLMAQDCTQSHVLNLTQEFLGMMLGAQRTTVTVIASTLQRFGLIEYSRGKVTIVSREGLEGVACDCYQITKNLITNLYETPTTDLAGHNGFAMFGT